MNSNDGSPPSISQEKVSNSFKCGVTKFQDHIFKNYPDLNRFQLHFGLTNENDDENYYNNGEEDLEEDAEELSSEI